MEDVKYLDENLNLTTKEKAVYVKFRTEDGKIIIAKRIDATMTNGKT